MTHASEPHHASPGDMRRERLETLLDRFVGLKILVVGDLMLDEYIWGHAGRVSPEAPVLVVEVRNTTYSLGGATNVANYARHLGAAVSVAGVVGSDSSGVTLREKLRAGGCDTQGVLTEAGRPTTLKTRIVAQNQQVVRVDRETREEVPRETVDRLLGVIESEMPTADAIILSDYAKGVLSDRLIAAVIRSARDRRKPVTANLKPPRVEPFHGATLVTLNLQELERAEHETIAGEAALIRCGSRLRERLDCGGLLVTRGGDGLVLFMPEAGPVRIPARRVEVFDVVGAGDAVITAAVLSLAAGADCAEAAALGNVAGNIKVTKAGTAAVELDEIRRFLDANLAEVRSHADPTGVSRRAAA